MKKNWQSLLFSIILFGNFACKTTQPVRPMEEYLKDNIENRSSTLNIPLKIDILELEKSVNSQLPDPLYKDTTMDDGDNLMLTASKLEDITLGIDSQMVTYRVPLLLDITYNIGFTNVKANGEIALNFKTAFNIKENWELETATILDEYEWLRSPTVRLGGVSLPVGFIANIVINRSKELLSTSIDEQVKNSFDFKSVIEATWKNMFDPMLVSEEYSAWLNINPLDIGMTQLNLQEDTIESIIIIESQPKITLGQKPGGNNWRPLPLFKYRDFDSDEFHLFLNTEISYDQAESITKEQILGETYTSGKRSVTIEDIELYGQGENLVVNTQLSGSFNGNIFLTGKPVFNRKKNRIDVKDLNYTLETKSFLLKTAGWLLKSTVKKQIQDNLNFLLEYNLEEMEKQIKTQLSNYQLSQGVSLNGDLYELVIDNAYLTPNGIRVYIALNGQLGVYVKGLN